MANEAVNGKQYIIFTKTGPAVAPSAELTWESVVCLTSNSFAPTDNQIDASSKCTDGWNKTVTGERGWAISGEAQAIMDTPDAGTASWKKFVTLWKSEVVFPAMIADRNDLDSVVVRGNVKVTDIPIDFPNNDLATFSLTLTGQGEPFFDAEV